MARASAGLRYLRHRGVLSTAFMALGVGVLVLAAVYALLESGVLLGDSAPRIFSDPSAAVRGAERVFEVQSPVVSRAGVLDPEFACSGLSLPLRWSGFERTGGVFVLMMFSSVDGGAVYYWVLYNIPGNVSSLPAGIPASETAHGYGYQGLNSFGRVGYESPCALSNGRHGFTILLLHVPEPLALPPGSPPDAVLEAVAGRVVEYARLDVVVPSTR